MKPFKLFCEQTVPYPYMCAIDIEIDQLRRLVKTSMNSVEGMTDPYPFNLPEYLEIVHPGVSPTEVSELIYKLDIFNYWFTHYSVSLRQEIDIAMHGLFRSDMYEKQLKETCKDVTDHCLPQGVYGMLVGVKYEEAKKYNDNIPYTLFFPYGIDITKRREVTRATHNFEAGISIGTPIKDNPYKKYYTKKK